jgi:hypothetical protein
VTAKSTPSPPYIYIIRKGGVENQGEGAGAIIGGSISTKEEL